MTPSGTRMRAVDAGVALSVNRVRRVARWPVAGGGLVQSEGDTNLIQITADSNHWPTPQTGFWRPTRGHLEDIGGSWPRKDDREWADACAAGGDHLIRGSANQHHVCTHQLRAKPCDAHGGESDGEAGSAHRLIDWTNRSLHARCSPLVA